MKAQALIGGAIYGPDALKVICKAFDDAWAHIQHHFDGDIQQVEEVRLKLAHAILAVATETSTDPEEAVPQGAGRVFHGRGADRSAVPGA
jgi:hypothetical protein